MAAASSDPKWGDGDHLNEIVRRFHQGYPVRNDDGGLHVLWDIHHSCDQTCKLSIAYAFGRGWALF